MPPEDGGELPEEPYYIQFVNGNKALVAVFFFGFILLLLGIFIYKKDNLSKNTTVEVLDASDEAREIIIEVSGSVENPGVYKFSEGARISDAIEKSGGIKSNASVEWVNKNLNKAAKLLDGQKIYIPSIEEVDSKQKGTLSANEDEVDQTISEANFEKTEEKVNINNCNQESLEKLWGIGPVYAQNIIEHRPYSTIEEVLEKKIIKKNVYERIKDQITVY